MALNSAQVSEAPKITSIHHKSNPTCVWPLPEASDYSLYIFKKTRALFNAIKKLGKSQYIIQ